MAMTLAKYEGTCSECLDYFAEGDRIGFDADSSLPICEDCYERSI